MIKKIAPIKNLQFANKINKVSDKSINVISEIERAVNEENKAIDESKSKSATIYKSSLNTFKILLTDTLNQLKKTLNEISAKNDYDERLAIELKKKIIAIRRQINDGSSYSIEKSTTYPYAKFKEALKDSLKNLVTSLDELADLNTLKTNTTIDTAQKRNNIQVLINRLKNNLEDESTEIDLKKVEQLINSCKYEIATVTIDLTTNSIVANRKDGDNVVVRMFLYTSKYDTIKKKRERVYITDLAFLLTVKNLGLHSYISTSEVLSTPAAYMTNSILKTNKYISTDAIRGNIGVQASYIFSWGWPNKNLRGFEHPLGIGLSATLFMEGNTPKNGIGVSAHLLDNIINFGWGYNLNNQYPYFLVGSNILKLLQKTTDSAK